MTRRKAMVQREANGRAQRGALPPVGEIKRLRDAALSGMRDPMWGTEIGRLHLTMKIDAAQFAAGKQWGEYAAKYSDALQSPSPDPRAVNFDRGGGEPIDPDSQEGHKEARRHAKAVQSFIDAAVKVKSTSGACMGVLRRVVEKGEMTAGHMELLKLINSLDALSDFWGLTNAHKSRHVR